MFEFQIKKKNHLSQVKESMNEEFLLFKNQHCFRLFKKHIYNFSVNNCVILWFNYLFHFKIIKKYVILYGDRIMCKYNKFLFKILRYFLKIRFNIIIIFSFVFIYAFIYLRNQYEKIKNLS